MSETKYITGTPELRDDILDFGNYVFSNAHRPHDFRALLPKTYGEHVKGYEDYHYLALRDGHIRGMVAMRPLQLGVMDEILDCGFIGTVSVHPYARGEGHMKKLMAMVTEDAKKKYDMMILGGQRQRYNYFGFERAGVVFGAEVNHTNLRHTTRDMDVSDLSFKPVTEADNEALDFIHAMQEEKAIYGVRPREELLDILHSWSSDCHVICSGDEMIGYIVGNDAEIGLVNEQELPRILKAWFAFRGIKSVHIPVAAYEKERIAVLNSISESSAIRYNEMIHVLNWPKVVGALLKVKASYSKLRDGRAAISVDGATPFVITVKDGVPTVTVEDVEPDLSLTTLEAERRLFTLDALLGEDELMANWLPLPFAMSSVDGF